jgi:anthranilate phosphoribosyltransferase
MRSFAEYIAMLEGDDCADERELAWLAAALLDGGVSDLELGALVALLRRPAASAVFLRALVRALDSRVTRWPGTATPMPVVIGCYGGSRELPCLSPLLALLLARFQVPVLMHGPLHADRGVSAALVLRELGIMPCSHKDQAARELESRSLAFVPEALLAPGLAALLALRARVGPIPVLLTAARLIDPFDSGALVVCAGDSDEELGAMRAAIEIGATRALLMHATDGEAIAHPCVRPRIEQWEGGAVRVLFDADAMQARSGIGLPPPLDVRATAAWIRQACDGAFAVPAPIVNQLAACLYAAGYCHDFDQAKALAVLAATRRNVA